MGLNIPPPGIRQRHPQIVWSKPLTYPPIVSPPLAAPLSGVLGHMVSGISGRFRVRFWVRVSPGWPAHFTSLDGRVTGSLGCRSGGAGSVGLAVALRL